MFKLSANSIRNREGVDERLIEISNLALEISLIDFGHGPYSGLRTQDEQYQLLIEGKSKADGTIKRSDHQTGRALDFFAFVDGQASWEKPHLAMVATAFLQAANILGIKIGWGGLWKSKDGGIYGWDMPHIYLMED